jgi:phage-related protein
MKIPQFKENFQVKFLEEAVNFLDSLDTKARSKIIYNIHKARFKYDKNLFKKLNETIREFRTLYQGRYYRLFAFWDKTDPEPVFVIITHGLIKKTAKTPVRDLERASKIMKRYINSKVRVK